MRKKDTAILIGIKNKAYIKGFQAGVKSERERVIGEIEELMEEISELRFDEWREPIDKVYSLVSDILQTLKEKD